MKAKKLLFLTGSRGEWGYIRPIIRLCEQAQEFDYSLCVTNMHLLPAFGMSVEEIEDDGFRIDHRLHMSLDGYTHLTMAKSLGIFLSSFADVISSAKPDWVILSGDRGEQLMGAIVSAFCYLPVAHIQAGELSGNIDGMTRHAIGKFAHLHLASNQDACDRLKKLGEEEFRIHNVGAPQLDELKQNMCSTEQEVRNELGFDPTQEFFLVVQHSVTNKYGDTDKHVQNTLEALNKYSQPKVIILPNNDAGSLGIREGIERYRKGKYHIFANVKRGHYLCLLRSTICLIGNSSSGLLEAPTFKVPAINLGDRQNGRMRASNVIDEEFDTEKICKAIDWSRTSKFRSANIENCVNPYGDGESSNRIISILGNTKVDEKLLTKNLTY